MWVDQGDMAAVAAALESLGYAPAGRTWKHARYLRPSNAKVVDVRGEHPDNPRPVEIHPRVVESFRGIAFDLTDRLDASGQTAGDAPMVLHLVAHATVDALSRRCRLVQLLDIAQLAPTLSRADWERLGRMAEEDPRFAWPALALAAAWLAAPVPEDLLARLEASVSARLRAWVARADPDGISRLGRDRARRPLLEVPTMWPQSHAERLRVWRYILWPSRDELADRDPESPNAPKWPRQYWRHMVYNGRLMARRLRQR
jgi:hypothetical protein